MEQKEYKQFRESEILDKKLGPHKIIYLDQGMSIKLFPKETLLDPGIGESYAQILDKNGEQIERIKEGSLVSQEKAVSKKQKKEIKDIAGLVRELMSDPDLTRNMVGNMPKWAQELDDPTPTAIIVGSLIQKAMDVKNRDQVNAAKFLKSTGWGDKIDINVTGEVGFFAKPEINFEIVEPEEDLLEELNVEEGEVIDGKES